MTRLVKNASRRYYQGEATYEPRVPADAAQSLAWPAGDPNEGGGLMLVMLP